MSLRWMCIKNFMTSQQILYPELLLEAVMKKGSAYLHYRNNKCI